MKKIGRRISAWILVTVLMVTSVQWSAKQAEAALDLSNIEVTVDIVNGGDGTVIANTIADVITIDEVTYNNYNKYEGLTAYATSEAQGGSYAIDGDTEKTRWESQAGVDPVELLVDFGCVYNLKNISIYWETASSATYEVWVSEDGNTFQKLTDVESNYQERTDSLTLSEQIAVRAVKLNCTSRTTAWGHSIYEMAFFGTDVQGEVIPVLSNLKIRDYYKYTGKYMLYFSEPEDVEGYNVYLDDSMTPIKTIGGAGEFLDDTDLKGVSIGEHTLSIASVDADGNESAKVSTTFSISDEVGTYNDIAQMYIYTPTAINSEYHDNKDVTITVVDEFGNIDTVDTASNIKIRGNTTAGAPKKPWNIKLDKKKSVLGMPKGKKWCILANSFDKSLIRNRLSYELGLQNGLAYNCESRYVEVYLNGKYNGNYLITEPVETGDGRVEIDPYNPDNLDILLELGTRNEADVDHFTTSMQTFDVNEPEKDEDLTQAEIDAKIARVNEFLKKFETVLKGNDYNAILEYIDEDSFVDFYIVNELFKNVDFNFSSTRFHINGQTIFAGPMWDLDLSSGNCKSSYYHSYYVDGVSWKGYYCQDMVWYRQLFKKDEFYNKVKARYAELQYVIQNLYKVGSTQSNSIDQLINVYGESFRRNYLSTSSLGAGWSLTNDDGYSYAAESGWTTWTDPIEFLRDWLENRNTWLCEQWGVDMQAAYEEGEKAAGEETTTEESTTEEPTTAPVPENTVAAFNYYGFNAVAGDDLTEYAYESNDYTYKATTGTGTMMGSVNGTDLKHIEWGSADDYGVMVPVMPASIKNLWSADAYVSYTFSTVGYENLSGSVQVGGTKKGPRDLVVGYYEGEEFVTLAEYIIPKNKTMYTIKFQLPETMENQENVTVYVKLTSTTNIGGNEMTSTDYSSGGELAFNNFAVYHDAEEVSSEEPSSEEDTTVEEDTTIEETTIEEESTSVEEYYKSKLTTDENLAYGKTATVSNHKEGNTDHNVLTDGIYNKWNGNYVGIYTPGYFEIDLGQEYAASSIDAVVVWFRNGDSSLYPANGYNIQFGNEVFSTVATVTKYPEGGSSQQQDGAQYMVTTTLDKESLSGNVSKIRIQVDQSVGWGTQITEIAVFSKNPKGPVEIIPAENPAGVTVSSEPTNKVYGEIKVNITAGESQEDYTYFVYLDNATEPALSGCVAGTDYTITGVESGVHTVKVVSYNGTESEGLVSDDIHVKTIVDSVNDSDKNLALNKDWFLYEDRSVEGSGSITNGVLSSTTLYGDYVTTTKGVAGTWFTIDLGEEIDASYIEDIYVWYRTTYPGCYPMQEGQLIQYSTTNTEDDWTTVATLSQDEFDDQFAPYSEIPRDSEPFPIVTDVSEVEGTVRYIRVYYPEAIPYGAQVSEIVVLGTVGEEESSEETTTPEDPEVNTTPPVIVVTPKPNGLAHIPSNDGSKSYQFTWNGTEDAMYYKMYVNDTYVDIAMGTTYTFDSSYFTELGTYSVGITAVDETGAESEMETITFVVQKDSVGSISISDDVAVEGYQISSTLEGSRVVGSVEPVINGKEVVSWGFVYAITQVNGISLNVNDMDMYVGSTSGHVASMESTAQGTLSVQMGESDTATYFVRTTLFSSKNKAEFTAKYKVRTYAELEDGTYVYSDVSEYSVYDIADGLYQNKMMANNSGHEYLYNGILSVVDSSYEVVDYNWSNSILKPNKK